MDHASTSASDHLTLRSPIGAVPGIGPRRAREMSAMGLRSVAHLIRHFPMRHERIEAERGLEDIAPGTNVTARGEVASTRIAGFGRKSRFEAVLVDDGGRLDLVWFNGGYLRKRIHPGMRLRVHGKAKQYGPNIQIANPKFEILKDYVGEPIAADARLRPVYPATEAVNSELIERAIRNALPGVLEQIDDHLDPDYRDERSLPALADAYRMMHMPEGESEIQEARRRLAYDELLLLQLGVFMKRAHLRRVLRAPALRWSEEIDARIRERFPFSLTSSQDAVVKELVDDLSTEVPTNRLIQGDVGSGKTIVALYAMLMAVATGHQAALMVPTEILAEQHFMSISRVLEDSGTRVELLVGGLPVAERASIERRLIEGDIDIVVGTHALLTESVRFKSLAVAIIDEQHRFGVHQRSILRGKGADDDEGNTTTPHVVVMTATPIPRTIALSLFGDLDVSTITGMPPGRPPINTRVVKPEESASVYEFVRERVERDDQAFIVVPAIDVDSDDLNDLRKLHARLEANELEGKRVAAIHGRMKRHEREVVMDRFRRGKIDALVATTVIEVGVDIPNATVMVIEHAERFGLAQLHQLRGRIGRGTKRSVCILIGDPVTPEAEGRLAIMQETRDGFRIAERDLEIRGPGEVFGTKQAGVPPFLVADLMRDRELLAMARRDADEWIAESPALRHAHEETVRRRLLKSHGQWLGLGDVG